MAAAVVFVLVAVALEDDDEGEEESEEEESEDEAGSLADEDDEDTDVSAAFSEEGAAVFSFSTAETFPSFPGLGCWILLAAFTGFFSSFPLSPAFLPLLSAAAATAVPFPLLLFLFSSISAGAGDEGAEDVLDETGNSTDTEFAFEPRPEEAGTRTDSSVADDAQLVSQGNDRGAPSLSTIAIAVDGLVEGSEDVDEEFERSPVSLHG